MGLQMLPNPLVAGIKDDRVVKHISELTRILDSNFKSVQLKQPASATTVLGPFWLTTPGGLVVTDTAISSYYHWVQFTVQSVYATLEVGGTTDAVIIDINKNGSTILPANKLFIDATHPTSATAVEQAVIVNGTFAVTDKMSFDVDQADSGLTASGLAIYVLGKYV